MHPLHYKDAVTKTPSETPCYNSSANNNLVNNQVVIEAGFRLLNCTIICFGIAGGGTVDSDCGQQSAILGPDRNSDIMTLSARG